MAEWRQLMKRVGKFKYDIYWNKKYYYSKGSAKTDWDFVLNLFSFSVASSSYLSSFLSGLLPSAFLLHVFISKLLVPGWHHRLNRHEFEWTPGSWWWTGRSSLLRFVGSQRVGHDWATERNWTECYRARSSMKSSFADLVWNKDSVLYSTLYTTVHKSATSCGGCMHVTVWKVKVKSLGRVRLCDSMDCVAQQPPPSMWFSRLEYWSGLPFPSPGDLPDPGMEPRCPALRADALLPEPDSVHQTFELTYMIRHVKTTSHLWKFETWRLACRGLLYIQLQLLYE